MVDLTSQMATLAERLGPPPGVSARVVQFVAAEVGAGVSTVAREFALEMSRSASRGVWLVELDLMKGEQHSFFEEEAATYGELGPPARSSPSEAMFFTVSPKLTDSEGRPWSDVRYLLAQSVGQSRLWVTRFRRESLRAGQTVQILCRPEYWDALRPHADYVVIDAPALERSPAARAAAPFVDANVLVISAANRNVEGARALREEIIDAGGRCAGMVLTHAHAEPPAFLQRLARK